MNKDVLALNLKNALNKLQHTVFDKEFLGAETVIDPAQMPETFFSFAIGKHHFVVNAHHFCEVLMDIEIASLPNSPELLMGLCNIRGVLIPVYQLHELLAAPSPKKIIAFCIGKGERAVGLLVDALPVSLSLRRHEKISSEMSNDLPVKHLTTEAYFSAGKMLYVIEGDNIGEQLLTLQAMQTPLSTSHYKENSVR